MGYRQKKKRCYDLFMLQKWLAKKTDAKSENGDKVNRELQQLREWAKSQLGQMAQLRGKLVL